MPISFSMIWREAWRFSRWRWSKQFSISFEWMSRVMIRDTPRFSIICPTRAAVRPSRPFFLCCREYGYAGSTTFTRSAPGLNGGVDRDEEREDMVVDREVAGREPSLKGMG